MAYKRELIAQTKNLFNISKVDTTTTLNVSGNAISAKNTSSDPSEWSYANSQYKTTLEAGTYHLSFDNINTASSVNPAVRVLCRSDAGTWITIILDAAFANNKVQNSFTLTEKTNVGFQFKLYTQVISNIQLEKNSTATDYVPYGHLSSYKKLLKVSDVCQLLDKSKYPATQTLNGVTYTNNGDGAFTISGSATDTNYYRIGTVTLIVTHLYYMGHTSYTGRYCKMEIHNGVRQINSYGNGIIFTCEQTTKSSVYIDIYDGEELNIVYKPQLYDLTEMYGAGNEPSTIEEFKAKFPNELYDYSPRCWVKSYKTGLIAETKNLFNYSGKLRQRYDIANGTVIETLPNGAILQGNVGTGNANASYANGWFRPGCTDGYGTEVTLSANDTVTISADYEILERNYASPTTVAVYLYGSDNLTGQITSIETGVLYRIKGTYTITKDGQYYPVFSLNSNKVKITNIQIEKGTTVTDYVPFGYL